MDDTESPVALPRRAVTALAALLIAFAPLAFAGPVAALPVCLADPLDPSTVPEQLRAPECLILASPGHTQLLLGGWEDFPPLVTALVADGWRLEPGAFTALVQGEPGSDVSDVSQFDIPEPIEAYAGLTRDDDEVVVHWANDAAGFGQNAASDALNRVLVFVFAAGPFPVETGASTTEDSRALCERTYYARDGRTLFDVEARHLPPPLRPFTADCASRLAAEPDGQIAYTLLYIDLSFQQLVDIVRSFENAGWGQNLISTVHDGSGDERYEALSADDLEALGSVPLHAHARFSNAQTGRDIITLTYTDGVTYGNDVEIRVPSLVIEVIASGPYDATGFDDPSVLSNLKTIRDAAITPVQGVVLGGSAVMLMLVVGYPGSLLGSVVGARYDRLAAAVRARWRREAGDPLRPARRLPRWLIWPGFLAAAIIGGFVDPAFGLNLMSLRVLTSGLLAFLVFNLGVWSLVKAVMRRVQPDARPYIRFRWGSLVMVAIAVLVARLLEFNPGVIFGLVAGLAFGMTLAASRNALVILLGSGFGLVAAATAWSLYSLLAPVKGDNALTVFAAEFLSAVTIEGISTLPLALLPLARLDGATLLKWRRWVWALAYAVGLAAFMFVLFTVPASWGEVPGDFLRWIALFLAFAVIAVAIWAIDGYLARRRVRRTGVEEAEESELQG